MRFSACLLLLMAGPALAQGAAPGVPTATPRALPKPKAWTLTIGVAPLFAPAWQGSRDYALSIFPDLRLNYRDDLFFSIPDGLGWNMINRDGWKIGPLAKIRFGRQESTGGSPFLVTGGSEALRGFGDVGLAGEFGGFAQYGWKKFRARAEVRQGVGGHEGVIADTLLGWQDRRRDGKLLYGLGLRATWASADYTNTYFGVSAQQAAAAGLPAFRTGSGLVSTGLNGSLTRPLGPYGRDGAITLFGGYDRLADTVADSTLIQERGRRDQFSVGIAYGYRFGWN